MTTKTIEQLSNEFNVGCPTGTIGSPLIHQDLDPKILKVDARYQRVISRSSLKKQGQFNWHLAVPAVVAKRPDSLGEQSGYYLLDGQHKAIKLVQSGSTDLLPCSVYVHSEDSSYDDCMVKEAEIFFAINTLRKSLTPIEQIRVGVQVGDEESLKIEEVMKDLNIQFDGFGSDTENEPIELKGFTLFRVACNENNMATLRETFDLLLKMYPDDRANNKKYCVTGPAIYSAVLLKSFMDQALNNARREALYAFVTTKFRERYSMNAWTKGLGGYSADQHALHRLLDDYRTYCKNIGVHSCYIIADETIATAAKINADFANPFA